MSTTLLEVQRAFRAALLTGEEAALRALVRDDGLAPEERIDVYRNNVVASLTEVLADTYPAVRRLVDPRFFAYAAHEFLTAHPPTRPRLAEYGAELARFLADFAPCKHLTYLPDVARLEWLVHSAAHAPEAEPLSAETLRSYGLEQTPRLVLRLHPSLGHLESRWPIDRIWSENRGAGSDDAGEIDLDAGGVLLEVARSAHGVVLRKLDSGNFAFRAALRVGATLEAAAEAALSVDGDFELRTALVDVFASRAVVSATLGAAERQGDHA